MKDSAPNTTEWKRLYEAAARVQELAPWEWMLETDLFGVEDPEGGETGYVSVMGFRREHFAVAVYLGTEALASFCEMHESESRPAAESVLETPQLQASFEDRGRLRPPDLEVIRRLGLSFRGPNAWPMFRSYRPGLAPWLLEPREARFLAAAMEQLLEVAPRARFDRTLLRPETPRYLVRRQRGEGEERSWEEILVPPPMPEQSSIPLVMDMGALGRVRGMRKDAVLEADFFLLPGEIHEKGSRPFYMYLVLAADAETGLVLPPQDLDPRPGLHEMWGKVPRAFVRCLDQAERRPREVRVRSERLRALLGPVAEDLGFALVRTPDLPALDPARQSLFTALREGFPPFPPPKPSRRRRKR